MSNAEVVPMEWEHLGDVMVDTGQLLITDPCYIGNGHSGGAITFDSGYGDGIYPVMCQKDANGRIVTVLIDMELFGGVSVKGHQTPEGGGA